MRTRLHPVLLLALLTILLAPAAKETEAQGLGNEPLPPAREPATAAGGMTIGQAVVLGVVEGLTEYLPVSSTGHLLLAERVMGIGEGAEDSPAAGQRSREAADAYAICIQAGAIVAVLGLYRRRIGQMLAGVAGRSAAGLGMAGNVVAAFLPAAVIGLLLDDFIKAYLFGVWPVVAAWFAGGVAILIVAHSRRNRDQQFRSGRPLDALTWQMAVGIGFAQCLAMWPGVSRSLITILGGVLAGLSLPAAVEFSFLLGVVTLGAATSYDALKHGQAMLQTFDVSSLAAGLAAAFVFAVVSVKWMVSYLNRHGLAIFGYYRCCWPRRWRC